MRKTILILATTLSVALVSACGDGAAAPDPQFALAAGDYAADGGFGTYLLTTVGNGGSSETIDWLSRGASISLALSEDGTTSGRVFAPGADEDGGDFDEDLAGTWSITDGIVRFSHVADTFLRDMDFVFHQGILEGQETFNDITVRLILIRL